MKTSIRIFLEINSLRPGTAFMMIEKNSIPADPGDMEKPLF